MISDACTTQYQVASDDALQQIVDLSDACTTPYQVARDFARSTNDSGLLLKLTWLQQIAGLSVDLAGLERLKRSVLKLAKMSERRISQKQVDTVNAVSTKVQALADLTVGDPTVVLNFDKANKVLDDLCDPEPRRASLLDQARAVVEEFTESWARDMTLLVKELQAVVLPELQFNRKDEFLQDETLRAALLSGQPQKAKKLAIFSKEVTAQATFWRLSSAFVPQHLAIKESAVKLSEQATETCLLIHVVESIITIRAEPDAAKKKKAVEKVREDIVSPLKSGLILPQSLEDELQSLSRAEAWLYIYICRWL